MHIWLKNICFSLEINICIRKWLVVVHMIFLSTFILQAWEFLVLANVHPHFTKKQYFWFENFYITGAVIEAFVKLHEKGLIYQGRLFKIYLMSVIQVYWNVKHTIKMSKAVVFHCNPGLILALILCFVVVLHSFFCIFFWSAYFSGLAD